MAVPASLIIGGTAVKKFIVVAAAAASLAALTACGPEGALTAVATAPAAAPESQPTALQDAPRETAEPELAAPETAGIGAPVGTASTATVTRIIDGDTIDTTAGRVRVIGIDTPEQGQCGYEEATANAASIVPVGSAVALTAVGSKDDRDKYDRLLRFVTASDGTDLGLAQIGDGLADARYDSRDGYGWHPKESAYIVADTAPNTSIPCAVGPIAPAAPAAAAGPWNSPGPDLDCADIGRKVWITGPDYHGLDADGDGWGCESYG